MTPTPARETRLRGLRVKAAGVILAVGGGARSPDHAGPLHRAGHGRGRPGAGRRGLRRADVGPATGTADGHLRRARAGCAVGRRDRDRRAGEDDGRVSGRHHRHAVHRRPAAAAVRRIFGATVLHAVVFMGLYVLLDLRHFGTPYAAVARTGGRQRRRRGRWRFSWSSFYPERWSGGERGEIRDSAGEIYHDAHVEDRRRHHDSAVDPAVRRSRSVFSVLAVSFWVLQVVQHAKFEEMAENNHQRTLAAARAARHRLRPQRQGPRREPPLLQHLDRPRAHQGPEPHRPPAGRGARHRRSGGAQIVDRHRREPIVPADHDRAGRDARAGRRRSRRGGSTSSCRTSSSSRCRRGGYPETLAAHLFGYVGEVSDAHVSATATARRAATSSGQSGIEKVYNAQLMGEDGARRVVVNSVGREIRTLEEDEPTEGKRLQLTHRLRRAEGDRGRVQGVAGFNGAAVVLDPSNGDVLAFTSRAGLRSERASPPASIAPRGRR